MLDLSNYYTRIGLKGYTIAQDAKMEMRRFPVQRITNQGAKRLAIGQPETE